MPSEPDSSPEPHDDTTPVPDAPDPVAAVRPPGWLRLFADRTAVLVLGSVAGFVVGLSFAGRQPEVPAAAPARVPVSAPTPVAMVWPGVAGDLDPRAVRRVAASGRVRVGVFGDSFGMGVWDALYRQLPRQEGYDVLRFSKEATGFTRYRQLDLEARAKAQLADDPVDIAVISFGANDAQPLFAEHHLHPLMSDGWQRIVGDRVDRFVATARSTGAIVYWVGLPIMRDPQMDADMRAMDDFYARHMRRLGVTFLDSRPLTTDAQGRYTAYLPDAKGVPRLMRMGDGLHMIGIGYQRLTDRVATDIRAFSKRVRAAAGVPAPVPEEGH